jgi:hypothetical protein
LDSDRASADHARMNSQVSTSRARLEQAEALLRDALAHDFAGDTQGDAASLNRILVHMVNMQRAISGPPDAHVNVAKRLADFGQVMTRLNKRRPSASDRLARLSEALKLASSSFRAANEPMTA